MDRRQALALLALTYFQLLCFFHRFVPSALKETLKAELGMSDSQTGLLFTAFVISYMIVSPLSGYIADKRWVTRKLLIVIGVLIWSVSTGIMSICPNYWTLMAARVVFGSGQGIFATLSTPLLCDFFPPRSRSLAMSILMAAIPVGSALGFSLASLVADLVTWRIACVILAAPGFFCIPFLLIREPEPGCMDEKPDKSDIRDHQDTATLLGGIKVLFTQCPTYIFVLCGVVFIGFAIGCFADWLTAYFTRYYGLLPSESGTVSGALVVVGGLFGTMTGAVITEKIASPFLLRSNPGLLVSGIAATVGTVFGLMGIFNDFKDWMLPAFFICATIFFVYFYLVPLNTLCNLSVPVSLRGRANGIMLMISHLFGDATGPFVIGAISDASGQDLRGALLVAPLCMLMAALIWIMGWFLTDPVVPPIKRSKSEPVDDETSSLILHKSNRGRSGLEDPIATSD